MQGIEGELDTIHAAFLHGGASRAGGPAAEEPGLLPLQGARQRALRRPRHRLRYRLRRLSPGGSRHQLLAHRLRLLPLLRHAGRRRDGSRRQDERLRPDGRRAHPAVGDLLRNRRRAASAAHRQDQPRHGTGGQRSRRPLPAPDHGLVRTLQPRAEPRQRLHGRPRGAAQLGVILRHSRHPPAGHGRHRDHGSDLPARSASTSAPPTR